MASSPSSSFSSSPSAAGAAPASSSYWCYNCDPFVRATPHDDSAIAYPNYGGGILEEMGAPPPRTAYLRHPCAHHAKDLRLRRTCCTDAAAAADDRSPFNPVIVLCRSPTVVATGDDDSLATVTSFELFYDDGMGSGLRPLPETMWDFLMGSVFERLLDQLTQIEAGGLSRARENPPASKASISMPRGRPLAQFNRRRGDRKSDGSGMVLILEISSDM
ncbi:E3 ubiquitin-protein ligase RDUF2-like [Oryza glaberrima]|uniref:E3 ubiquitin-protein ligase RDUF2-like n=1 Tax=Oryza glaberrima TaxID=4538 RepID=UPI00224BEDF4|nr:E3 ubiquitin-protein ligase RDUF2-like [Oryza glaberrima]